MPMFHMEHCVFCTFLSKGTTYKDCGRPCETHVVHLRDRVGQLHRLQADVGCPLSLLEVLYTFKINQPDPDGGYYLLWSPTYATALEFHVVIVSLTAGGEDIKLGTRLK